MRDLINLIEQNDDYDYSRWGDDDEGAEPHEADSLKKLWPKDVVNIPEFQQWFAGSKVVDERGLPILVHRGRAQRWSVMPTGHAEKLRQAFERDGLMKSFSKEMEFADRIGDVAWFTDDEFVAHGYMDGAEEGDVLEAYLCLKNPLDLRLESIGQEEAERIMTAIRGEAVSLNGEWSRPAKVLADKIVWDNSVVVAWARANGYDGLMHNDTCLYGRHVHHSYVAFRPDQIKAAANTGAFSKTDVNIHR